MKILGVDVETTGLDVKEDRIIEIGAVVWCTEDNVPLEMYSSFVKPPEDKLPLSEEVKRVTGIKDEWVGAYGRSLSAALNAVHALAKDFGVEYVLAHNGENYDRPLILNELSRAGISDSALRELPWIDTRTDLPFAGEPDSRRLVHLATDHGFLNPFKHRAIFDVLTMLKVTSHYPFAEVIALSQIPWVTVRALVDYDNREKAKACRFMWEQVGDKKYPKMWVKRVREHQLELEVTNAATKGFKAVRIE